MLVRSGMHPLKYWFSITDDEQQFRFMMRIHDPLKQWKLSPMDTESFRRWYEYSVARDMMLKATDSKHAPWFVINSNDKKRARLNCITHLLSMIPHKRAPHEKVKLPTRDRKRSYDDHAPMKGRHYIPEIY